MRKTALVLAALLAASFTTAAEAAKKKRAPAKPAPIASNEAAGRLVIGAITNLTVLPAVAAKQATAPAKKAAKRSKKKG